MAAPINLNRPSNEIEASREAPHASGKAAKSGPIPPIDTGDRYYKRRIAMNVSDQLYDEVRIAASLSKMTVREFILRLAIPEIKRVFQSHNMESEL